MGIIHGMSTWELYKQRLYGNYTSNVYMGVIQATFTWELYRQGKYVRLSKASMYYGLYTTTHQVWFNHDQKMQVCIVARPSSPLDRR
jgi:hypothetical protein